MKPNLIRTLVGGISLSTALFVFQACYGTPQDFGLDTLVEGNIISAKTGEPIKGIKISISDAMQYELSDDNGNFSFYVPQSNSLKLSFEDIDGDKNGLFAKKDTLISTQKEKLFLRIKLDDAK